MAVAHEVAGHPAGHQQEAPVAVREELRVRRELKAGDDGAVAPVGAHVQHAGCRFITAMVSPAVATSRRASAEDGFVQGSGTAAVTQADSRGVR